MSSFPGQIEILRSHSVRWWYLHRPSKIQCVKEWPVPQSLEQLQNFLGFVGYYRRFIKDFSKTSHPLYDLFKGTGCNKKKRKGRSVSTPPLFQWTDAQQTAFDNLIAKCCEAPVLGYADYSSPFVVHTDASLDGLGAVLYQKQDGKDRVISYVSRRLSPSERNCPVHKLEFLALKWAVTDKFHDYPYGNQFTAYTDNNPLTYVLTTAKLDAMWHRWVAALSQYNFDIVYRTDASNRDADALSRIRWPQKLKEVVPQAVVQAMCQYATSDESLIESVALDDAALPDQWDSTPLDLSVDWQKEQAGDPMLKTVHTNLLLPVRSVPTPIPSKPKSVPSQTPILTLSHTRLRDKNDCAPRSDSSPESLQSHDTVSTVVPQPQTSVIAWKADSSLDLDEDETSVLLDESVVRSEDGGATDRSSEGGDHGADISESDSDMDPGNESTGQMRLSPDEPCNQELEVFHQAQERFALGG